MFHGPVCDLNQLFQTIYSIHIQYTTTNNQPKNNKDKRSNAINFYHKNVLTLLHSSAMFPVHTGLKLVSNA